jgi:hypothetical protein
MRSHHILFTRGGREPWTHMLEQEIPPKAELEDGTLVYRRARLLYSAER